MGGWAICDFARTIASFGHRSPLEVQIRVVFILYLMKAEYVCVICDEGKSQPLSYLLLRGARQLLTMSGPGGLRRGNAMGQLGVIDHGAILVRDGVIEQVGASSRLERLAIAKKADEFDASGRVVLPTFVDCYTHLLAGPQLWTTRQDSIRAFETWSPQRQNYVARRRIQQFVRYGTSNIAATCGYSLSLNSELSATRLLDELDSSLLGIVPLLHLDQRFRGRPMETLTVLEQFAAKDGVRHSIPRGVIVGRGHTTEEVRAVLRIAESLRLRVFVDSNGDPGMAAALTNESIGAFVGLESATSAQAQSLASMKSTPIILLPGRMFQSGQRENRSDYGRLMVDTGVALALATGFDPLESPTMSMPMMISLACSMLGLSTEEALVAGTVNSARAIGLGDSAGSLQAGMPADWIVTDCSDYREIGHYFGINPVAIVVRGGRQVFPARFGSGTSDV